MTTYIAIYRVSVHYNVLSALHLQNNKKDLTASLRMLVSTQKTYYQTSSARLNTGAYMSAALISSWLILFTIIIIKIRLFHT